MSIALRPSISQRTSQNLRQASTVHFGKRDHFSQAEAKRLTDSLSAENKRLEIKCENGLGMGPEEIIKRLTEGQRLPLQGTIFAGIIYPDGKIVSADSETIRVKLIDKKAMGKNQATFKKIMEYILAKLPAGSIPAEGVPVIIRQRDPVGEEALQAFVNGDLNDFFNVKNNVALKNGKEEYVVDKVTWPFFEAVIADAPVPDTWKPLTQKMADLPIFQLTVPGAPELEKLMREKYGELRRMLVAMEAARFNYSQGLDWHEAAFTGAKAAGLGIGGELAIEHYFHDGGASATVARGGLLAVIDAIENALNTKGILKGNLDSNGLTMSKKTFWGDKGFFTIAKEMTRDAFNVKAMLKGKYSPFQSMTGPGGIFGQRAASAVAKGTALGAVCSAIASPGLAVGAPVVTKPLVGSIGALGTATSIPFNVRSSLPNLYLATLELLREKKLPVPADVKTEDQLKAYALATAQQELYSRTSYSASTKAMTLLPVVPSGIFILQALGLLTPEMALRLFMFTAPATESGFRLLLTAKKEALSIPARMSAVESKILDTPDKPFTPMEVSELRKLFGDRWAKWSMKPWSLFSKLPEPVQLADLKKASAPKTEDAQ